MSKLRDDLLRNLSPDDQTLMKTFRRRPLKAYIIEELLPKNADAMNRLLLGFRLEALISQNLVMKIFSEGQTYHAKAKERPSKKALF